MTPRFRQITSRFHSAHARSSARTVAALFLLAASLNAQLAPAALSTCDLDRGTNLYLSEGATDTALHPPSVGTLPVKVIFVDFSDAPADGESAEALYNSFIPAAVTWFDRASVGRLTLAPSPEFQWFRMPLPSSAYGFDAITFARHIAYLKDAVAAADASVNFAGFQTVYVVSSKGAKIAVSPALLGPRGRGVIADGAELRLAATFGNDVRNSRAGYGSFVAVHETLHLLGLPDLYRFGVARFPDFLDDVGGWDLMGWVAPGAHPFAWHSRKLGWIDESQSVCMSGGLSLTTLTPLEVPGGVKSVVARIDASRALVVEYRTLAGLDSALCDSGVLVYLVDARAASGNKPIEVLAAARGSETAKISKCGPKYEAPFDIGAGEIPSYTDPSGIRVEVLSKDAGGAQVRVSYPPQLRRRSTRR